MISRQPLAQTTWLATSALALAAQSARPSNSSSSSPFLLDLNVFPLNVNRLNTLLPNIMTIESSAGSHSKLPWTGLLSRAQVSCQR